jgi:hypothetical protein
MPYTETKTLTASDAADNDHFGRTVVCSADGSIIVVGVPNEDGAGTDRGKVYVYSGSSWATETILTASDAANNDFFGAAVALSADGSIIAVGAEGVNGAGTDRGKVYVYSGSSWATETMLTPVDPKNDARFGAAVALSADGSILAVGAYGWDGSFVAQGKVCIRVRRGQRKSRR